MSVTPIRERLHAALRALVPAGVTSTMFALGRSPHDGTPRLQQYVSMRRVPVWPHEHDLPGEGCSECRTDVVDATPLLDIATVHALGDRLASSTRVEYPYVVGDATRLSEVAYPAFAERWLARRASGGVATIELPAYSAAARWRDMVQLAATLAFEGRAPTLIRTDYFDPTADDQQIVDRVAARCHAALGAMGGASRAVMLQSFEAAARTAFAKFPTMRSMMLLVGQYYNDGANDEVHGRIYGSTRKTPLYPHWCSADDADYTGPRAEPANGEWCRNCGGNAFPWFWIDSTIEAIEMFCPEGSAQGMDEADRYRPYALARPGAGDAVDLELIGSCRRPWTKLVDAPPWPWPGPRAVELARLVADHPRDAASRHVLADHLIECGDPRGEVLARELRAPASAHACDRATALYRARAIYPLGCVIVADGARFRDGMLAHVDVHAADGGAVERVRGAEAWHTVESLRYLPGSSRLLDPAMRALREVGELTIDDVPALADVAAWPIEAMQIRVERGEARAFAALAPNLPHLKHLLVAGTESVDVAAFAALARVTLVERELGEIPDVYARVPRIAWCARDELGRPAGWQLVFMRDAKRAEITLANWSPTATLAELAEVVAVARTLAAHVALVPSRYYTPTIADRERAGLA